MDSSGNIISLEALEDLKKRLTPLTPEEEAEVRPMNRAQRRAWAKRHGKEFRPAAEVIAEMDALKTKLDAAYDAFQAEHPTDAGA